MLRQQEPKHLSFKSINIGKPRTYVFPDGKNAGDGRTSIPDPRVCISRLGEQRGPDTSLCSEKAGLYLIPVSGEGVQERGN